MSLGASSDQDPFVAESLFVGRQPVVDRLSTQLTVGQSLVLIGGRRTGKTQAATEARACRGETHGNRDECFRLGSHK